MREYAFVIEKGTNCWGAYSPDLPGLGVTGDTPEEAERLIREGIELHLEALSEHGDAIPEPAARVGTIKTDIVETSQRRFARSA